MSWKEFDREFRGERAHRQNSRVFSWRRWSRARSALITHLSQIGLPDETGYGTGGFVKVKRSVEYDGGDFFVLEDWFKIGVLSLVFLHWSWLTPSLAEECRRFAHTHSEFVITIEKALPRPQDLFTLVISPSRCYIGFYQKQAEDAWRILKTRDEYSMIRNMLEDLR